MKYEILEALIFPDEDGNSYFDYLYQDSWDPLDRNRDKENLENQALIASGEFCCQDMFDRAGNFGVNPFNSLYY